MVKKEKWKTRLDPEHVFHFTNSGRVVRTDVDDDNIKILHVTESGVFNFSNMGKRASVADFQKHTDNMAGWERVV